MDDRACFCCILHALELLQGKPLAVDLIICASTKEEMGGHGSQAVSYRENPDYAVAIDVCHARTADAPEVQPRLGDGPVISVGSNSRPKFARLAMPSVTPVCFASMYTGALPDVHGIKAYVKPVLKCDTLFDAALRAHLRTAIVSTANDSISVIFLERQMDYYIYPTLEEVNNKAVELLEGDRYDLIVVYNPDYDANMLSCDTTQKPSAPIIRPLPVCSIVSQLGTV